MTKSEGKTIVKRLVDDFEQKESYYISKDFQETEVRNRFIDPFFTALGWNFHQTNIAKIEWDVHREFSQRDNSSTKKPDYAFRAKDGYKFKVKFFVEAKAPWVKLTDLDPVYQAKRYAFSSHGKTPIVILTDFQEFRVFNGFQKPIYENPLQGLIVDLDIKYTQYLDNWDRLWELFSKDAVQNGSITNLTGMISKNTKTLDDEFLSDISGWREVLAKHIAFRNNYLSVDELNEAVQRIIDRLVFIRNLEDRGIELEGSLLSCANTKENVYQHLITLFRNLDSDYNGLLFKKHFSEDLVINDKVIKDQIKQMCYPISPYQFDEIEPEILGRIYEQFLGSKIRLTDGHSAKIEVKPEVRHAGGVYYTPQYIVDYIVKNTVGKKIAGKNPQEISEIAICDPACGSGSFLLGAYDYLMNYHKQWYLAANQTNQKKYKSDFYVTADHEVKLTLKKRSEILNNNIFGVDIDREATEVAIMSLYLKLLDDGFDKGQVEMFMKGHILPDMSANIKCGNSLIKTDFFDGVLEIDPIIWKKINPFDWNKEFSGNVSFEGFDCIIGNPPYLAFQEGTNLEKKYFTFMYKSAIGKFDQYVLFIEQSIKLLKENGIFGFIVPNKFIQAAYGQGIKKVILEVKINEIVDFNDIQVFKNATNYPCIINLSKDVGSSFNYTSVNQILEANFIGTTIEFEQSKLNDKPWSLVSSEIASTMQKLRDGHRVISDFSTAITQGVRTGHLESYFKKINANLAKTLELEAELLVTVLHGKNTKRFYSNVDADNDILLYPHDIKTGNPVEIKKYPRTEAYLSQFREALRERKDSNKIFKNTSKSWYEYWDSKPIVFTKNKIVFPDISEKPNFFLDDIGLPYLNTCYAIIPRNNDKILSLLGILNSQVTNFFIQNTCPSVRGGFYRYKTNYVKDIPIPHIDVTQDELISGFVKKIIALKKELPFTKTEQEINAKTKMIDIYEDKVNELVYKLFSLTARDIEIIEKC